MESSEPIELVQAWEVCAERLTLKLTGIGRGHDNHIKSQLERSEERISELESALKAITPRLVAWMSGKLAISAQPLLDFVGDAESALRKLRGPCGESNVGIYWAVKPDLERLEQSYAKAGQVVAAVHHKLEETPTSAPATNGKAVKGVTAGKKRGPGFDESIPTKTRNAIVKAYDAGIKPAKIPAALQAEGIVAKRNVVIQVVAWARQQKSRARKKQGA